jgi:hypothetical protein
MINVEEWNVGLLEYWVKKNPRNPLGAPFSPIIPSFHRSIIPVFHNFIQT